jgi:hypothetical protein
LGNATRRALIIQHFTWILHYIYTHFLNTFDTVHINIIGNSSF